VKNENDYLDLKVPSGVGGALNFPTPTHTSTERASACEYACKNLRWTVNYHAKRLELCNQVFDLWAVPVREIRRKKNIKKKVDTINTFV
jgi:hypothetical protein